MCYTIANIVVTQFYKAAVSLYYGEMILDCSLI